MELLIMLLAGFHMDINPMDGHGIPSNAAG
jgi:hypothetical protein